MTFERKNTLRIANKLCLFYMITGGCDRLSTTLITALLCSSLVSKDSTCSLSSQEGGEVESVWVSWPPATPIYTHSAAFYLRRLFFLNGAAFVFKRSVNS